MFPRGWSTLWLSKRVCWKAWGSVCVCVCVSGLVRTHCIKSDFGPHWCETKCRSSIRIKSPYVLWDPVLPRWCTAGQACVWWLMAFVFSSSLSLSLSLLHAHTQHSQTLPFPDLPRRAVDRCAKSEQHNQKSAAASGHRLPAVYMCFSLFHHIVYSINFDMNQ